MWLAQLNLYVVIFTIILRTQSLRKMVYAATQKIQL